MNPNERIIKAAGAALEADIKRGGAARARNAEEDRKKTGAGFNRGGSKQDYATPRILLDAIKAKFGFDEFDWDLAAVRGNSVAEDCYFGPDQKRAEWRDSLKVDWPLTLLEMSEFWLNPPFSAIAPWAKKCAETAGWSCRIFFLIPAAVGSNWWKAYVHKKARVYFLNGRPSFDGKNGYPKDVALCVYGEKPGYFCWRWQPSKRKGSKP